jgi:hypothetical protein
MRYFQILCLVLLMGSPVAAQSSWDIPSRHGEILIDGYLKEWDGIPALTIAPSVAGLRKGGEFSGDSDVSLKVQALWDPRVLYLALTWKDDVWDVEEVSRENAVWIDAKKKRRDRMFFFDYLKFHIRDADYDYTFWLSPRVDETGPFFWCRLLEGYKGMERATASPMVTARQEDGTVTMEVMLLWKELKIDPKPDRAIPLTLILSDSDLPGRMLESKLNALKWVAWRGEVNLLP